MSSVSSERLDVAERAVLAAAQALEAGKLDGSFPAAEPRPEFQPRHGVTMPRLLLLNHVILLLCCSIYLGTGVSLAFFQLPLE